MACQYYAVWIALQKVSANHKTDNWRAGWGTPSTTLLNLQKNICSMALLLFLRRSLWRVNSGLEESLRVFPSFSAQVGYAGGCRIWRWRLWSRHCCWSHGFWKTTRAEGKCCKCKRKQHEASLCKQTEKKSKQNFNFKWGKKKKRKCIHIKIFKEKLYIREM